MENNKNRIWGDIFIFGCGIVLAKMVQFFLMPLYTSYMTTDAYGVAELVNSLTELFFPIITVCIYEAAFRFAVDEQFDNKIIVNIAVKILIISFACVTVLAVVVQKFFYYQYTFHFLFILYALSLKTVVAYYIRGKGLTKEFAISGVINAFVMAISSIVMLIFFSWGVDGYLLSIGVAYICAAIYLIIKGKVYKEISLRMEIAKENTRMLLKYSLPLIVYNIIYSVNTIAGRYILLWYANSEMVGIYVAAIKISAVINAMQQAVYSAFQFTSASAYMSNEKERYYSKMNNLFTTLYCILGSFMICITPLLTKITLKNEFVEAEKYLPIIMLGAIINCVSSLFGAMYSTYKITNKQVPVSIIGAGLNVFFCIILIPKFGIWGACLGSFISNLGQAIYKMADVTRTCKLQIKWSTLLFNFLLLTIQTMVMSKNSEIKNSISFLLFLLIVGGACYWWKSELLEQLRRRRKCNCEDRRIN